MTYTINQQMVANYVKQYADRVNGMSVSEARKYLTARIPLFSVASEDRRAMYVEAVLKELGFK